ncbi:hypothetical protein ACFQZE_17935 [Paenibacillus sp. GCM10027627]
MMRQKAAYSQLAVQREAIDMGNEQGNGSSIEQKEQAARNKAKTKESEAGQNGIDKKLNGPNRPST